MSPPRTSLDALGDRETWHRLGMHLRLGLRPDDPRVISAYLRTGERLLASGHVPWQIHDRTLSLLLATACDDFLPMAWRLAAFSCQPSGPDGVLPQR